MAQVPNDQLSTVQEEPIPGRAIPRLSDDASPAEFGFGIGAALGKASQDARAVTDEANQTAVIKANTALINAKNDQEFNPDSGAYTLRGENAIGMHDKFMPQFDQAANDIGASLANPAQKAAYAQFAAKARNEYSLGLNRHEYEQQAVAKDEIDKNAIEAARRDAEQHYTDPELVQSRKDEIALIAGRMEARKGIPGLADNLNRAYGEQIDGNVARGMIDKDPMGSLKKLISDNDTDPVFNNIKDAKVKDELILRAKKGTADLVSDGVTNSFRQYGQEAGAKDFVAVDSMPGIPDDVKDMIRGEVIRKNEQLQKEMGQKFSSQIEAVDQNIASGHGSESDIASIRSLMHNNAIGAAQGGSKIGDIIKQMEAGAGDEANKQWALDRISKGLPMDPTDTTTKKAVNDAFGDLTKDMPPLSDAWVNQAAAINHSNGIVPSDAVSYARSTFISGDEASAGKAALAMRRWQTENPAGFDMGMDEKTRAQFGVVGDALQAGADPAGAITYGRTLEKVSKDTKERLNETWQKLGANTGERTSLSALKAGLLKDSRFKDVDAIPPDVQGAYERITHDMYIENGGNRESAQNSAIDWIKNKYGVSGVNGKPQLMAWAPEHLNPNLTTQSVKDAKTAFVRSLNEEPVPNRGLTAAGTIKPYDAQAYGSKPMTIPNDDGTNTVIPTVVGGKQLSRDDALKSFLKTNENFGTFKDQDTARLYTELMGRAQERITGKQGTIDPDKVQIVPDQITEYSQGQKWRLGVPDEHGLPHIMADAKGVPLTFTLPNGHDVAAASIKAAGDAGMAEMKGRVERMRLLQAAKDDPNSTYNERRLP